MAKLRPWEARAAKWRYPKIGLIFTSVLKVSDKFIEKCRRRRFLVNDTWAKWGFEILPLW